MDDSDPTSYHIHARPGAPHRLQNITSLRPQAIPNDYVDTGGISDDTPYKHNTSRSKNSKEKSKEQRDNITNQHKESIKNATVDCQSPALPPRLNRPPPLPPRTHRCKTSSKVTSHPIAKNDNLIHEQIDCRMKVAPTVKHGSLQPVLIVSEHSQSESIFSSLCRGKHTSPVRDQPKRNTSTHSDITVDINSTGTISSRILCPKCRQCRCQSCIGDRELPERWLCQGTCRCSSSSVVDTLSCMCCVRPCLNHCVCNQDDSKVDPCACSATLQCCFRWTALSVLSVCLPCLLCYWPLKGGVALATSCYNSTCCRQKGCNCDSE